MISKKITMKTPENSRFGKLVAYLLDPQGKKTRVSARDMIDRPSQEAGLVLSTTKSYLDLYRDPTIAPKHQPLGFPDPRSHALRRSGELVHHHPAKRQGQVAALIRIVVNMIVRLLADKMDFENGRPKPTYKHKLLAMIDEFPALGKLEILQESLAFVAGYGIKCYLISQDINQLKSRETGYGPDETITSNCHVQTAFPPNRLETAEHLSKLTGQTTIIKSRSHVSAADLGLTFQRRCKRCNGPLLTPDEDARTEERHPGPHH
jgi:type IV secretion system protein VirD4